MIRDRDGAILKWHLYGHGDAPPPHVQAAMRARQRELEVERMGNFAEPYRREDGSTGNIADHIEELYEVNRQLELKLGSMTKRSLVRLELAHAIESRVTPLTSDPWIRKLPSRLREARKSFCLGFRPANGSKRLLWDMKAGLSRICPDDAREDSRRLNRRVIEPLLELKKNGRQVTYCVFTLPNYQPGKLRQGMKQIFRQFGALLKRRKGGRLEFHNVDAALCILEAPLAWDRTWNVHLNVMLVHRGFLDWKAMQAAWRYGVHFQRIRGGRAELEAALREIIKYSARAVAEKSECTRTDTNGAPPPTHAGAPGLAAASTCGPADASPTLPLMDLTDTVPASGSSSDSSTIGGSTPDARPASPSDRPPPPAMADWTGQELLEWLQAFRGFRRTRTYRALYRLPKPASDDLTGYVWVGKGELETAGWRVWIGPLFSIPGDKSTTPDALERWKKLRFGARPPPRPPDKCERFA